MIAPLISDPFFYAVAVPAVLLLGISKSGFGTGFGALAVPLMATAITVPQAAAIMMPLLLVMDLLGIRALRHELNTQLLRLLLPYGLLGTAVGALLFHWLDAQRVAAIVGGFALLVVAQRLVFPPRPDSPAPPRWAGRLLTIASGFASFVAHAGGPPISAYVIPLRLQPLVYAATLSYFFFFLNLSKWLPYAWLGLIDLRNMLTALVLMPLAPIGVWLGVRMARRISPQLFYRLVYAGLSVSGVKLLWDGLR